MQPMVQNHNSPDSQSLARRVLREPLVHFLAIAAVLVGAHQLNAVLRDRFRIVMTAERVNQLVESYRLQFGVTAGPDLREALVQKDFEDEVLYRQALALKLDEGDEIIRRRLIQKMQFVSHDRQAPSEPSQTQLDAYFLAHRGRYRKPPAGTFTHVFFSTDVDGVEGARARAAPLVDRLNRASTLRAPTAGDLFPDLYDFSAYEPQQVTRLFGQTEFSAAVFSAPVGRWSGPFRSAYGWHLLRVDGRQPPADASFDQVRDRVRGDYLREVQDTANVAALSTLKAQFRLIRQDLREDQ
jgi:peptidyl-prolyl cis-trans isomerase C